MPCDRPTSKPSPVEHRELRLLLRLRNDLRGAWRTAGDPCYIQQVILEDWFQRYPHLVPYLKLSKDPATDFGFSSRDLHGAAAELRATLRGPLELLTMFAEQRTRREWRVPIWLAYLARIPEAELRGIANDLLDGNLRCRLELGTLNRALRSLGYGAIVS